MILIENISGLSTVMTAYLQSRQSACPSMIERHQYQDNN
jgi:hypothetical protein